MLFLTGTYALVVGGRLDTFDGITIFIAKTDNRTNPILCWLFQKFAYHSALHFAIDDNFTFDLVNGDDAAMDLFRYHVSYEGITLQVSFWALIPPNIAAHNPALMWSTLCGKISFASVTKNMQWPSHLLAPRHCPNCCFLNITGFWVTGGNIVEIVPSVSTITG